MLETGQGGGNCCWKAIGEVDPQYTGKNNVVKINSCCCCCFNAYSICLLNWTVITKNFPIQEKPNDLCSYFMNSKCIFNTLL